MSILKRPIITEKMTAQTEKMGRYGFIVDEKANKLEIKKAVEGMYNVTVDGVHTMRYGGKRKSRFTKSGVIAGRKNNFKKAIVQLKKGETIDFYSSI
ncbi:MAG TPA: 50S ribosomal protein L23 [Bacteroidia bacterium]|nr:50S ribosomal protein L23 [Bacteroidia bacterium]